MKNNEDFFINITPGEAPDLNLELSSEEKAQLLSEVLAKIEKKQAKAPKKKLIIFQRRLVSVAAAAVLLVVSTTAIATITNVGFKKKPVVLKENQQISELNNNKKKPTELTSVPKTVDKIVTDKVTPANKDKKEKKYVYLNCDKLDGYTVTNNGGGWYSFENEIQTLNFDCQVIYADTEWSRDYIVEAGIKNSKNMVPPTYQWKYIENKKALYVKYKKNWVYSHQLFVRYKDSGYSLNILAPSGIEKSELMDIGRDISLDICPEELGSDYVKFSTFLENYKPEEMRGNIPTKEVIDYSNVVYKGGTTSDSKVQITLDSVSTHKNISGFISHSNETNYEPTNTTAGRFYEHIDLNSNLFTEEDGTLSEYVRSYVYIGDGINTPRQKIVYQDIEQRFCVVKLRVKNISQQKISDFSLLYPLRYVRDEDDYYYDTDVYSRPVGINSCQINNMPKYFSPAKEALTLESGQEQVVELGYFVDEDLTDNAFMLAIKSQFDLR